ncbi:MAG TPA: hypothetical protein VII19_04720 [Acidimicrobiales bacterium]
MSTMEGSERSEDQRGSTLRATGPLVRATWDSDSHNRAELVTTLGRIKARAEA